MTKAFWIFYELILLVGCGAWGMLGMRYARLYNLGKENFEKHINAQTEKGLNRQEAYKLVSAKKQSALIKTISSGAIVFCFVYAIVDILFTHIIGG
jgi:hypothetical protein